jgi:multiple sugar transport system substrate-binding protein
MDGVNFASQFEDAAKSKVVGKVGYAMLPSGPGGHFSPIYITGMAVSSQSRSKEAGYLFAQWATSKTNAVHELTARPGQDRPQRRSEIQLQDVQRRHVGTRATHVFGQHLVAQIGAATQAKMELLPVAKCRDQRAVPARSAHSDRGPGQITHVGKNALAGLADGLSHGQIGDPPPAHCQTRQG